MKLIKLSLNALLIIVSITFFTPFVVADQKKYIDFPGGKVVMMRFKSKIDSTSQPLLLKTPDNYSTKKAWPLLVVLHGFGDGPILAPEMNSMIQIGPYGRGDEHYKGIGEKDVLESVEFAKTIMPIDENKIYLTGFSMGGFGTFRLASRFPDIWAACVPVCPRVPQDFRLQNCTNVPFWIHTGLNDHVLPPEPCAKLYKKSKKVGFKKWLYTEHKDMGHSFDINWKDTEEWLLKHKRMVLPEEIDFVVNDLQANSAYWIEVKRKINTKKPASVKGKIDGETVNVEIDNISSLKIDLSDGNKGGTLKVRKVVLRNGGSVVSSGKLSKDGTFSYDRKNVD